METKKMNPNMLNFVVPLPPENFKKRETAMATITLQYDGRSKAAKSMVSMIEESGLFNVLKCGKTKNANATMRRVTGMDETLKACKEVDEGKVIRYKSFEDFKKRMYAL